MARRLSQDQQLQLIDCLTPDRWHSGEALAGELGITRAALAKRIDHLREWGLNLASQPGLGYRVDPPLVRLSAEQIRACWPGATPLPKRLQVLPQTDSTNQQLLQADVTQDPQVLLAEMQTAGRGRRGREWFSPFGANIYLSVSWTYPAWPADLGTVPLACGVVCARVLREFGLPVMLKWPNDLRLNGRKLGGILVEQRGEAGGACRIVVGVGINDAMQAAQGEGITQPWTSVREASAQLGLAAPERNALAAALSAGLLEMLAHYQPRFGQWSASADAAIPASPFAKYAAQWSAWDETAARPVVILQGESAIEGIAQGIDASGALQVDVAGQRRSIVAGEVSLRLVPDRPI